MQKDINIYYKTAISLGRTPLIIGTIIFFLWLVTHNDLLAFAGAITILIGFVSVILGVISLLIYLYKSKINSIKNSRIKIYKAFTILLINFPLVLIFIMISSYIRSTFTITIDNQTNSTIKNIHLTEFKNVYNLPDVLANTKVSHNLHFKSEGQVDYSIKVNRIEHTGILFGYITSGVHGDAHITITDLGKVLINSDTSIM